MLTWCRSLVFRRHDPDVPPAVSGVIRLADKYLIEPLHRRLVREVRGAWPTTIIDYDIKQAEIESVSVLPLNARLKYGGRLADVIPEPASAILFAQEFNCPEILPAAFYTLSLIPVAHDWDDGQLDWELQRYEPLARWSILDRENLVRYLHGCQSLNQYRPRITHFMCNECRDPFGMEEPVSNRCYQYIKRLFEVVWDHGPSQTHGDPLRLLAKCYKFRDMPELSKEHLPDGICEDCDLFLDNGLPDERKKVWGSLAERFKLK